ncbi:MAG: ribonuclease HII [Candidatus Dadabacteria bacterium]|nr:MAG: ribonuclease HII [Candidatus Dadabacteria bacterium]
MTGRPKAARTVPEMLRLERLLWDLGYQRVAGVDEVGLGPLAGPVVAAAVVFPIDPPVLEVADSKRLTARKRERLDAEIRKHAAAVAIGVVEVHDVDRLGVREAGVEAMRRAVVGIDPPPDYLLVDACRIPGVSIAQSAFAKADSFIFSVAAASIVAKVFRDHLMRELDRTFPGYGFGAHMGYGTRQHIRALARLGPSPVHRRSFEPVRRLLGQ